MGIQLKVTKDLNLSHYEFQLKAICSQCFIPMSYVDTFYIRYSNTSFHDGIYYLVSGFGWSEGRYESLMEVFSIEEFLLYLELLHNALSIK